jgi:hypothetical protein
MADVKQVESIGTVKTVVGIVKAVDQSGAERILQAGDKVYANETVVTADGGLVLIEFADGSHLDLASASQIILDSDVFNPANAKGEELTAEQIQEMIARGEDPTAVTEATAAGAGSGDEGGSSFVDIAFNNTKGHVNSGLETQGVPGPDSIMFTEQPPVEDDVIVLSALADEVSTEETVTEETPTEENGEEGNAKINNNNGFGNGDQDAPGNSGPHNNAENATNEDGEDDGKDKGNNGFGNGDQDAPGDSESHNNAENATDEDEGDENSDGDAHKGNNGFGNGDQDAPGNSESHNNAENASEGSGVTLTGKGNSNDILIGGDGDDTIIGGAGVDTMTGGAGADEFVWESGDLKKADGGDTITDFNVGEGDTLNFDDLLADVGGTLGIVEDDGNTTVTLTTTSGTTVDLVTLTGVTGETLNTLLGTTSID